jgi:hypothetical protein
VKDADDDDDDDEETEEDEEDDESVEGGCSSGCCLADNCQEEGGGCNAEELRLRDQDLQEEEDTDGLSSKLVSDPAARVTDADNDEAVSDSAGESRAGICSEDTLPPADSIEKTQPYQPVSLDKPLNPSQPDRVEEMVKATTKDDEASDSNRVAEEGDGF